MINGIGMEFLKSLITKQEAVVEQPLEEAEKIITSEAPGKRYGDYHIYVTRFVVDNYDLRDYTHSHGIANSAYGGNVSEIWLGISKPNEQQYKAEVIFPQAIDSDKLTGDAIDNADIFVYLAPDGPRSVAARNMDDPELEAMLEKMVAGYLKENIQDIVKDTFYTEGDTDSRQGYRPSPDYD